MEQINAAYNVLDAAAEMAGDWAGHVNHVPMQEKVAGIDFDQQAEVIINGLRVTAHSQSGQAWPVYVQIHELDGSVSRVIGYYTLRGISFAYGDIARATGIYR